MTMTVARVATNRYVGSKKARPDSRVPRKLTTVSSARMIRHRESVYGSSAGSAETSAPTPVEMPTATLST
jgi:hypothetical protein